jgi:hypothetical protein
MRNTDQKKFIEQLKKYERKFSQEEQKEFMMLVKRHKDDEDLDNISFQKLKDLHTKYYANREKIDLNEIFKKK